MMSFKVVAWALLAALGLAGILLLNYWASYQPLSTLTYLGIGVAACGLANLIVPFRFLGIRKRAVGALILAGGVGLAVAALHWPASMIRVAQPKTHLDKIMPEYQFSERHSARVHALPEQVMQAVGEATFSDMKSLATLLKIRGAVLRAPTKGIGDLQNKRIADSFREAGYLFGGSEHEIVMCGGFNVQAQRRLEVRALEEFAKNREPGAVIMAFDFTVEEAGDGWSTLTAETRVVAPGGASAGMARYWRMIVPGSGLLRLQWLEGIKRRAESAASPRS